MDWLIGFSYFWCALAVFMVARADGYEGEDTFALIAMSLIWPLMPFILAIAWIKYRCDEFNEMYDDFQKRGKYNATDEEDPGQNPA